MISLLLALAAPAHAALTACPDRAALRQAVRECGDNSAYSDAAKSCVDQYEASVAEARKALAGGLAEISSADRQAQGLNNANTGYAKAIASLDALVKLGGRLQGEIKAYEKEIVFPDDFASIAGTGFSTKTFLDSNPCYKSTRDLLKVYGELMGSRARELELTAKIARALAAKARRGEGSLKPEEILPMLTRPPAAGAAPAMPVPRGKSPRTKSDITGTGKKNPTK